MKGGVVRALQLEVAQLKAQVGAFQEAAREFRGLLHSDKFAGPERDWINTADVLNWLRETESGALDAYEGVVGCPECGKVMKAGRSRCVTCEARAAGSLVA